MACARGDDLTLCQGLSVGTTRPGIEGVVMAWAVLFIAGLLEIGWAVGLKHAEGFSMLRALPAPFLPC